MKILSKTFIAIVLIFGSFLPSTAQVVDLPDEARKAADYVNKIRANPSAYSSSFGVNLSDAPAMPALVWNETLAKVAMKKARDMASREYFDHVTPEGDGINIMIHEAGYTLESAWVSSRSSNYFESISAGVFPGEAAIKDLIIDEGVNPPGHRQHLLGMKDFWANCTDIGIGYVRKPNSIYQYYMVVVIAKQTW